MSEGWPRLRPPPSDLVKVKRLSQRSVEHTLPGALKGVGGEKARLVCQVRQHVGVMKVRMLGEDERDGMLHTEGVEVFGERYAMGVVDGVDDFILSAAERLGQSRNGEVGIEEGMLFLNILIEPPHQCCGVAVRGGMPGQMLGAGIDSVDRMANIEKDGGKRQHVGEVEEEGVVGEKGWVNMVAKMRARPRLEAI